MLPIILIMSILCQGHAVDYGTEFVTAFPENLAYYFPATLTLSLKITTFVPNTNVNVYLNGQSISQTSYSTPQVYSVEVLSVTAEISQFGVSGNSIRITSDKNITVLSISTRGDSIQTNVVTPTTLLGTKYLVPSPNYTELAVLLNTYNASAYFDSTVVPMDFSFRLLIINAEAVNNSVTIMQNSPEGFIYNMTTLGPYQLILMPSSSYWSSVTSAGKVAVIITNPCIDTQNCRCNMVAHQLRPSSSLGNEFIVPSYPGNNRRLFVTSASEVQLNSATGLNNISPGSIDLLSFPQGLTTGGLYITTPQPILIKIIIPGLIIDVLPNILFSGCYLVHTTSASTSSSMALLIVETDQTNNIYMGTDPLSVANWTVVSGTVYSWGTTSLGNCQSCVIWHPTSRIAVYVFEQSGSGVTYGGPAISLSDQPDPNGCVVVPMALQLGNVTMSWQESRSYCISKNMVLVSPNVHTVQEKMGTILNGMATEGAAWVGLRRSLVTSDWYWHSQVPFGFTNWDYNQPTSDLCVSIMIEPTGNFSWHSVRCCSFMLPLCAQEMVIIGSIANGVLTEFNRAPTPAPPAGR